MNKKQSNLEYVKGVYGKNYANLRKKEYNSKKDYTVRELADKLFISASTISAIEKETRLPTVDQVLIYKKFFGVSLLNNLNIVKFYLYSFFAPPVIFRYIL